MKILQIHNKYIYQGGEDSVYNAEKTLLENYGHEVIRYEKNNDEINSLGFIDKVKLLNKTYWNNESYYEIRELIKMEKPDICHVHNYMPLISPSVFYACKDEKIPVIQTLHNYRMLCSNAYLFRNSEVCEECLGKTLYNSVKYGCYRNSKLQTYTLSRMIEKHKKRQTWNETVDGYICLTEFAKKKFIEGGLTEEKLFIKPNFINDDFKYEPKEGKYFLFIGRLDETKGIKTLIEASKGVKGEIKIAGDGPLKNYVENNRNITYLGQRKHEEIRDLISNSTALIFPSIWYETFGLTIIEAFASGKPVIACRLGAAAEIIVDGKTGLLFEPGNAGELAKKINWADRNREEMEKMGFNARKDFENKYSAERNYELLMNIYMEVIERGKAKVCK